MSVKDMSERIGQQVMVNLGGLMVECIINDIKNVYGRVRYNISPVAGTGSVWVENVK